MQKLSTYMIRTLYSPLAQVDWHAYCQNSIIVSKWETILLNDRCDFFLHKYDNYYLLWLLYYCKSFQIFLSEFILYVYEWFFKIVLIWFNTREQTYQYSYNVGHLGFNVQQASFPRVSEREGGGVAETVLNTSTLVYPDKRQACTCAPQNTCIFPLLAWKYRNVQITHKLNQWWLNVGPASQRATLKQHWFNVPWLLAFYLPNIDLPATSSFTQCWLNQGG